MKNKRVLFVFSLFLSACQSWYVPQARNVKRKPRTGGVVAMPANPRAEDRQKAEELMRQTCTPAGFVVEDEGEAVVGQETKTTGSETNRDDTRRNSGNFLGMNLVTGSNSGRESNQSSVTTQLKEWQITYSCEQSQKSTKK